MPKRSETLPYIVICRVGSLENQLCALRPTNHVICRVGSLEMMTGHIRGKSGVICRVGSLEI